MATELFGDTFSSYSPGYDGPFNGGVFDAGGVGDVVNFGTMTGSSSATGFYERLGKGYAYNGAGGPLVYQSTSGLTGFDVIYACFPGSNNAGVGVSCFCDNANLSSGTGTLPEAYTPLAGMIINEDYTVSFYASSQYGVGNIGTSIANSIHQVIFPQVWQIVQNNYTFFPVAVNSTDTYIGVTGTFAVDGTICVTGTCTTNTLVSQTWLDEPVANQFRITGPGYIGEMFGYAGSQTIPYFPESALPNVNIRYTQGVVEYAARQIPNLRMTQGVAEVMKYPSRNLRMTQGVVEIILRRTAGGWVLYEA